MSLERFFCDTAVDLQLMPSAIVSGLWHWRSTRARSHLPLNLARRICVYYELADRTPHGLDRQPLPGLSASPARLTCLCCVRLALPRIGWWSFLPENKLVVLLKVLVDAWSCSPRVFQTTWSYNYVCTRAQRCGSTLKARILWPLGSTVCKNDQAAFLGRWLLLLVDDQRHVLWKRLGLQLIS